MIRRLYARVLAAAAGPHALGWLIGVSFAESSFLPIAPDLLLIPMVLARPAQAWRLAGLCTLASVAGGALGYLIGYALFDRLAGPLIHLYGYESRFEAFRALYAQYGVWVILVKGLTPIPYKLVTIASGAASFNFPVFMLASLVTRGARFFLIAWLLRRYGAHAAALIERRLGLVLGLTAAALVLGLLLLRLV